MGMTAATTGSSLSVASSAGSTGAAGSGYTYPLQVLSVPVREDVQRRVVGVVQLIQKVRGDNYERNEKKPADNKKNAFTRLL
jgi:hypothetical protein